MDIKNTTTFVVTLPSETLTSAKQGINDKLLVSLATYLRCGGVASNQIKKKFIAEFVSKFF